MELLLTGIKKCAQGVPSDVRLFLWEMFLIFEWQMLMREKECGKGFQKHTLCAVLNLFLINFILSYYQRHTRECHHSPANNWGLDKFAHPTVR